MENASPGWKKKKKKTSSSSSSLLISEVIGRTAHARSHKINTLSLRRASVTVRVVKKKKKDALPVYLSFQGRQAVRQERTNLSITILLG